MAGTARTLDAPERHDLPESGLPALKALAHHLDLPLTRCVSEDPLATMAGAISYRSEQCLDDGHEALPVLGGVPQQSGTDQDVVRAKLPELLSVNWDFGYT